MKEGVEKCFKGVKAVLVEIDKRSAISLKELLKTAFLRQKSKIWDYKTTTCIL